MQTRFTLRQLEYLVAVGRLGSVTLAAEQLSVSPPSISHAIAQLEQDFGLPLFVRKHAQGMAVTQSGRLLLREAARVLEAARALSNLADSQKGTVQGELAVGCLLTFAQILLPRLRRDYVTAYPDVRFQQFQNHQAGLIDALREAAIDIALTYDLAIPADLEFTRLGSLPPFALLAEHHPLAGQKHLSLAELAPHPMVLLDLPLSGAYFLSLFETAGVKPRIAERAQDMAVVQSLVANGFGYSIANIRPPFERAPDGKALRFVPLSGPLKPMRMGVLSVRGGTVPLAVSAFVSLCQRHLDEMIMARISLHATAKQGIVPLS
ncbi:MAG: LysR family transcriptional regulator [Rhodobacteraceae bacterium]|nr:LysR family transcriptional regulator [Paracoccaceae bacterium]